VATRQVGDETLSPRGLRVDDPVAAAAAMRALLGARR
jgi:hypothetical protein